MSNAKNKHRNIRKGGHVKTVRYHDLLRAKRTQNPLSGLNPAKVRRLYELYREGKYADVQLAWDALEEYDDMLGTVLERRQSALGEMEWDVLIDARAVGASSLAGGSLSTPTQGEKSDLQMLAEAQQDFITRRLRAVENLSDAIKWLGLADFRRYSALEVLTAGGGERWLPIHHWLLCRPALEGAWCYNENAETSCTRVEPIDMSAVLLREVARPIDLVAMFLISAKEAAIDGWDSFLEVFGNPALFFKMPPGTSDDQRDEYASIIKEISSDGAGVYPDGGEIHTVETSAANADAFSSRAEWCDKALVRRATGGLLTVLAESGSGTLAGSAHMEAFRQIAANDAISIAECINRQYVRRRLVAQFPGQPVLVYFTLTPPVINDRAATVNMLCQLAGQRWRATDEAVSEEVGVEVHTEPQPGAVPSAEQKQIITNACNQYSHDPGCPDAQGGSARKDADLDDTPDEMPEDADEELQERYMEASSMASAGSDREEIYAVTGVDVGKTELDREYEAMVAAGADDAAIYKQTGIRRAAYEQRRQKRRLSKHPRRVDQGANAAFERRKAQRAREAAQEALLTNAADSPPQPHSQIDTTAEPPLNDGELAALRALGAEPNPAQIAADADYMTREMMAGLEEPDEENESEGDVVANFGTSAGAYKGWENRKGANMRKQKGGSGSKGNPKNPTTKSNTPLKAAPGAKVQAQVDATEHALKSREAGGGVVKGAAWVKGKRIDVKGGSKATGGAAHMKNHYKPGDTSRREAAKDIHLGRKQKDRTEVASVGKMNKVILADKGDHLEPITTRRKKDND